MILLDFGPETCKQLITFNSHGVVIKRLPRVRPEAVIHFMYMEPGGTVGYHQAADALLFWVWLGVGGVLGREGKRLPIAAGQAAFWESGEWHESGTEAGMLVVVIEGEKIDE
jgi:hypothetical protein